MNFTKPESFYWNEISLLPERISSWILEIEAGTAENADLQKWAEEMAVLIEWQVYMDSYSRSSTWLLGDYLMISRSAAAFLRMVYEREPGLIRKSILHDALDVYIRQLQRGKISDPEAASWMIDHWS